LNFNPKIQGKNVCVGALDGVRKNSSMVNAACRGKLATGSPAKLAECLKQWAHEIHDMGRVGREALSVELSAIETEDE